MENIIDKTVAQIVTENIKTADVFKKNGIDFCCGGNVKVSAICKKKELDIDMIIEQLQDVNNENENVHDFKSWDLDFLADYIVNNHHKYILDKNIVILAYAEKVAKVHGSYYTEVIEINKLFQNLVSELDDHMYKEENIAFPYIKEIVFAKINKEPLASLSIGSIKELITLLEDEHDGAGDIIKKIAELSNNYTPPPEACNTFKALYAALKAYQDDLFQHIHLENNILFPKAIQIVRELEG